MDFIALWKWEVIDIQRKIGKDIEHNEIKGEPPELYLRTLALKKSVTTESIRSRALQEGNNSEFNIVVQFPWVTVETIDEILKVGTPTTEVCEISLNNALHYAMRNEYMTVEVMKKLLLHVKCDINEQNKLGNTVLHCAVSNNYIKAKVIGLLLQHGVNTHLTNLKGETALELYVSRGNINLEVLKQLLLHAWEDESYRALCKGIERSKRVESYGKNATDFLYKWFGDALLKPDANRLICVKLLIKVVVLFKTREEIADFERLNPKNIGSVFCEEFYKMISEHPEFSLLQSYVKDCIKEIVLLKKNNCYEVVCRPHLVINQEMQLQRIHLNILTEINFPIYFEDILRNVKEFLFNNPSQLQFYTSPNLASERKFFLTEAALCEVMSYLQEYEIFNLFKACS